MFSFHRHIPMLTSIKNLIAGCVELCPCPSWMDFHGGYHLFKGVTCLVYVIFLPQTKWQKLSAETVITIPTNHWYHRKADSLAESQKILFNYTLSLENAYQYYVTASNSKQSKANRYFDQIYQIWDDYMWVTPEKGQLIMIADICWEQDIHTIYTI